jgi:hypothetical protein
MKVSYRSVSTAAIVTIIVVTAVTLLGELSASFMKLLTFPTGHHWITKNFLSVIVFLIVLAITSGSSQGTEKSATQDSPTALLWTAVTAVVCSVVLLGFFVADVLKG